MKYQVVISECKCQKRPWRNGPDTRLAPKRTKFRPELSIRDVGYWQRYIQSMIDRMELDEHVTATVAKVVTK